MPDKDFDYLFPQAKANPVELRGYVWKVIVDPTRNNVSKVKLPIIRGRHPTCRGRHRFLSIKKLPFTKASTTVIFIPSSYK